MFGPRNLTRRTFLAGTSAAAGLGLSGLPAFADVNWKKFAGQKIEVNLIKSPRGDTLQKFEKEFVDLTGIQVSSEQTPEQQQRQKAVIELSSGSPSFDVIHISYHVQKRQFEKAGWLADISGFLKDATLTDPSLTESDFSKAGLLYAKDSNGKMLSLPFSVDYWIVYWNKDLFAKKGLAYPATFEEMVKAAEALTDPGSQTYGFVARGLKNANVPVWASFLLGYGGDFLTASGDLATDSPEAIEGAKLYQRLLTKSAPQGVSGFNWSECQSAFLQGRAASSRRRGIPRRRGSNRGKARRRPPASAARPSASRPPIGSRDRRPPSSCSGR
jgi:multiple sugar transport system substrate-binding protein